MYLQTAGTKVCNIPRIINRRRLLVLKMSNENIFQTWYILLLLMRLWIIFPYYMMSVIGIIFDESKHDEKSVLRFTCDVNLHLYFLFISGKIVEMEKKRFDYDYNYIFLYFFIFLIFQNIFMERNI